MKLLTLAKDLQSLLLEFQGGVVRPEMEHGGIEPVRGVPGALCEGLIGPEGFRTGFRTAHQGNGREKTLMMRREAGREDGRQVTLSQRDVTSWCVKRQEYNLGATSMRARDGRQQGESGICVAREDGLQADQIGELLIHRVNVRRRLGNRAGMGVEPQEEGPANVGEAGEQLGYQYGLGDRIPLNKVIVALRKEGFQIH